MTCFSDFFTGYSTSSAASSNQLQQATRIESEPEEAIELQDLSPDGRSAPKNSSDKDNQSGLGVQIIPRNPTMYDFQYPKTRLTPDEVRLARKMNQEYHEGRETTMQAWVRWTESA